MNFHNNYNYIAPIVAFVYTVWVYLKAVIKEKTIKEESTNKNYTNDNYRLHSQLFDFER